MYAEQVYFDGAHFAHIVCYEEHRRLARITDDARVAALRAPGYSVTPR
jgi:hypothetical protein